MELNINYCRPSESDMNKLVDEWWDSLHAEFGASNDVPKEGKPSQDGNYVFLYGHYDLKGYASGRNEGHIVGDQKDRAIFAPILNGNYGSDQENAGSETRQFSEGGSAYGDPNIGTILSRYATSLYANIVRGDVVIDIPQVHWIAHENPRAHDLVGSTTREFKYGIWICIDGKQLQKGDIIKFGGKGGPNVALFYAGGKLNTNTAEWLAQFETHAVWYVD
jgi:hypothetical protein